MTVSVLSSWPQFTGTGANTALATGFKFVEADDLVVIQRVTATGVETTLVKDTHYTVSGGGYASGTVTPIDGATDFPSTVTWTIQRLTDRKQPYDYQDAGSFPAEAHEQGLDRMMMIVQEVELDEDRSVKHPVTDASSISKEIPNSTTRASQFAAWDANGEWSAAAGVTDVMVSSFMETVLDDATALAARTTLSAQEDVITTRGDLAYGDSSGDAKRLALGAAGEVPASDGTDVSWTEPRTLRTAWPTDYVSGLAVHINVTDSDHDIDVSAHKCRNDDDTLNIILGIALTKQIDATWAAGTGAGGMEDGLHPIAGTGAKTYYIHTLADDGGNGQSATEDVGFDDSEDGSVILGDAAVVAAGLTTSSLSGIFRTDASDNLESIAYKLADGRWLWRSAQNTQAAATQTWSFANPFSQGPIHLWAKTELVAGADNWSAGDEFFHAGTSLVYDSTHQTGFQVGYDGTNLVFVQIDDDEYTILDKTTGQLDAATSITNIQFTLFALFEADAL